MRIEEGFRDRKPRWGLRQAAVSQRSAWPGCGWGGWGDAGLGLARGVGAARRISSERVRAREGERVLAGPATVGARQASGAPQGAEARRIRWRPAM